MLKIKKYFIFIIAALVVYPFIAVTQNDINTGQNQTVIIKQNAEIPVNVGAEPLRSALAITPQIINIGTIVPREVGGGIFTLKNIDPGIIDWSTSGPDGWKIIENQKLASVAGNSADYLHMEIRLLPSDAKSELQNVEMKLTAGGGKLICRKDFPVGTHKEEIKIVSADGLKTIFVTFTIVAAQKSPLINLNPDRLDMGSLAPDKTVAKKIRVTNSGKEMLTWSVAVQKHESKDNHINLKKSKYISFVNEEVRGSGVYNVPGYLKETIELLGKWTESNGYPASAEGENFINISFTGTGIALYLLTYSEELNLTISLDKRLIDEQKLFTGLKEKKGEFLIAEGLVDGPHILTIMNKDSRLGFEGAKILGKNTSYFPAGSIAIMPNSGATTSQTNYINIALNTAQMAPGYYADNIIFSTNGGESIVEVFVEVTPDNTVKVIDVYRYFNGTDYLFTSNPQLEIKRLNQNNYVKEGIAFRLFKAETPGTTSFYRWYNPQKKDHFYHYDYAGGGKSLQGYIFEGSIGNIATSRLTNTRELYRWYSSATGNHFYSTDPQGGKINKKRYRFDGIAGYVK